MALPVDQTATLIVTEALKQAGYPTPKAALITRAEDEWLRMILGIVSEMGNFAILEQTKITVMSSYQQRYALPNDADRILELLVYSGSHTGDVQAGTSTSVTLDATEDISEANAKGKLIFITSGTAINQMGRINAYNTTSKLANVDVTLDVTPVVSDTYMLADIENIIDVKEGKDISGLVTTGILPTEYTVFGKTPNKEIYFNSVIDDETEATIRARYIVYLHLVDLSDDRLTWIYNEMKAQLTQGVLAHALRDKPGNTTYQLEFERFDQYMNIYFNKDQNEQQAGSFPLKIQ